MWEISQEEQNLNANWLHSAGLVSFCMETLPLVFREKMHTGKLCNMVPSILKMNYFLLTALKQFPDN